MNVYTRHRIQTHIYNNSAQSPEKLITSNTSSQKQLFHHFHRILPTFRRQFCDPVDPPAIHQRRNKINLSTSLDP